MNPDQIFRSFQVQLIKTSDGILVARGNSEFLIEGEGAEEVVFLIFNSTGGQGIACGDLLALFLPDERPKIQELVDKLLKKKFLTTSEQDFQVPEEEESATDVFFWNFSFDQKSYRELLDNHKVVLVGVNYINLRLCQALVASGISNITVIDYRDLRNIHFFDDEGNLKGDHWAESLPLPAGDESYLESMDTDEISFLLASSDFGGTYQLLDWNRYCVENKIIFVPVLLDRCVGKVGPVIIPGESACYQCLNSRENSNLYIASKARIREFAAAGGQKVAGFLPSMASILGDIAAVEIIKFAGRRLPWSTGELIEVNLLAPSMENHKVLKLPRCKVCSNHSEARLNSPLKHPFMPDNYQEYADEES